MTNDCWQIHRHLAEQADQRLQIVKTVPRRILWPVPTRQQPPPACRPLSQSGLCRIRPPPRMPARRRPTNEAAACCPNWRKNRPQHCQALSAPLPEASADMLWSNLGLATEHNPVAVFASWAGALQTDGLLFFTHFGRDTLLELTDTLAQQGIAARRPALIDMHDLGDMLADSGFYDPVTDTARLKLEYRTADTFLQDMDTLGLWHALDFDDPPAARTAIAGLWQRQTPPELTLETVFGHAVKKKNPACGRKRSTLLSEKKLEQPPFRRPPTDRGRLKHPCSAFHQATTHPKEKA